MPNETEYQPADFPDPHADQDFDQSLLEYNLQLTPLQRLEQLDAWREFFLLARQARIKLYGFDPADTEATE